MFKRNLFLLTIFGIGILGLTNTRNAFASELTVCPSGCQYSSIQSAVTAAVTNDTVRVYPGSYSAVNVNKIITLVADTYDTVDPRNNTAIINTKLSTSGGSNWAWNGGPVVRGFKIIGGDHVVDMVNSPMTFEYNYVAASSADNVSFSGGGGIVRGNYIENAPDDNIDIDNGSKNILIENNYLYNARQEGIEIRLQDDSISQTAVYTIRNNRFVSNGDESSGDGIQLIDYYTDTNRRFVIENNLFLSNKMAGIGFQCCENTSESFQAASVNEEVQVLNNTFYGNNHGISGGANALVLNNIFVNHSVALKNTVNPGNINVGSRIDHNLFFNNTTTFNGTMNHTNDLTSNPLLDANYYLQSGSPAINSGVASFVWNSIYGTRNISISNYSGTSPDLGWKESGLSGGPSPTPNPSATPLPTPTPTPGVSPTPSPSPSPGIPGDANGDGVVNLADYQIWLSNYNKLLSGSSYGDFNMDGKVNGIDYVLWRMNAILTSPTPAPSPSPSGPTPTPPSGGTVKAFYGAEGFGANSLGGRGGKVIEVTNLNDSGTGSLRDCISQSGPRTCVFRVGGTITVNSQMNITNPYITIAGQTAPGGGITIRTATTDNNDEGPVVPKTHDVVIRYIRVRLGPAGTTSSCCLSGIRMLGNNSNPANYYNIIIDHVSTSWAIDENISSWFAQSKISVQWSIASEGLYASTHSGGELHSKGIFIGDHIKEASVHHNLMAHNHDRNPMMKPDTSTEIINNVVYNWDKPGNGATNFGGSADNSAQLLIQANAIMNSYIPGPDTPAGSNDKGISFGIFDPIDTASRLFVRGNIGQGRTSENGISDCSINDTNWNIVNGNSSYRSCSSVISSGSVTEHAVETLLTTLLNGVGNIPGVGASVGLNADGSYFTRRDAVDKRIIEEVNRGEGTLIDCPWYNVPSQSFCAGLIPGTSTPRRYLTAQSYTKYGINDPLDTNGWPILDPGTPFTDSDHDGMADTWETNNFGNLSRGSSANSSGDFDGDGYTDLEEFLNGTNPKT